MSYIFLFEPLIINMKLTLVGVPDLLFTGPPPVWERKLFGGLAQIIVQSDGKAARDITLTSQANG
jgi:hypothetical protein